MKKSVSSFLLGTSETPRIATDVAYALFRLYCGLSLAVHAGLPKLFHKIDEKGGTDWANLAFGVPEWFVKQVEGLHFTLISPKFWAVLAVYGEFAGGLLVAVGLLTRLSAAQMAFQFFVVAFLWYDEPQAFGMYFQQLIFWSFVLIAAMGDGRFSVAALLQRRRERKAMFAPAAPAA